MTTVFRTLGALALALLLVAAVSSIFGCGNQVSPAPAPLAPADPLPTALGATAPDFSARDFSGGTVTLSAHRGRVVVLSFWASWCAPCRSMFPHDAALCMKYARHPFTFVGVNMDVTPVAGHACAKQHAHPWSNIHCGPAGRIAHNYGVASMPTTIVIGRDGCIRHRIVGVRPDEIDAAVAAELQR